MVNWMDLGKITGHEIRKRASEWQENTTRMSQKEAGSLENATALIVICAYVNFYQCRRLTSQNMACLLLYSLAWESHISGLYILVVCFRLISYKRMYDFSLSIRATRVDLWPWWRVVRMLHLRYNSRFHTWDRPYKFCCGTPSEINHAHVIFFWKRWRHS
jgi:hypothetical protein